MDLLFMNVDLLAITSELGYIEDGVYQADENCKENLDSMLDLVQNDDKSGSCRQQLGTAGIFTSDLIPLLEQKIDDDDLFDSLIRLLTVLTDPVMFPTSINGNLTKIDIYNKKVIEGFMLEYKQSFHSAILWVKLRGKIAQFLRKESTKSSPDLTGLTLNFVRNLISIDDPELAQVIVICYADSGMARLIQYIASAADLDEWHLHATEIFSGLLKDTTPKSISQVDQQKDALKHCSFMRPCLSIQETKVEYTPSMEDRMLTSKTQKHYEHIFLHYYFSSISEYCAESMVRSLISKVDSIDGKYKIAVAQMCVWLVNFVTLFDVDRMDLSSGKHSKIRSKIGKLFAMGIKLSHEFVGTSDGNLMETFIQRSTDLLSIVNKLKKNSTDINYDDEFEALANDFIQGKMKDLLDGGNPILQHYAFEFVSTMIHVMPEEKSRIIADSLRSAGIIDLAMNFLKNTKIEKLDCELSEAMLTILGACMNSFDEVVNATVLRLIFANTTNSCKFTNSAAVNSFQISIFQHIKSLANDEEGLVNICRELVNDDQKLMTEMALLFQFTLPKRQKMSSSNDDMAEDGNNSSNTDPTTLETHSKAIQWLADKVKSESNGNQLQRDVILPMNDDMIKPGFEQILKKFGFIQISGKFILQKGPLNPDLYSKICETKLSASDSMMIVTARQIASLDSDAAGGKKKKKRGIGGKNKKLATKKKLADEGIMPTPSQNAAVQMEIF